MVGGRLDITSEEGKGTRAEVRIPFERSVVSEGMA
jgi:signal transduction histidine kinase